MNVNAIDHLVLNVRNVERACHWYQEVLDMKKLDYGSPDRPRTALLFGEQRINLRPVDLPSDEWVTARYAVTGTADLCFLTECSPDEVLAHLRASSVEAIKGPTKREGARGPLTSAYCRDPDGNLIEISSYD